jgi:hypothetical protein
MDTRVRIINNLTNAHEARLPKLLPPSVIPEDGDSGYGAWCMSHWDRNGNKAPIIKYSGYPVRPR